MAGISATGRISIQVSLSGYSLFSRWYSPDKAFTAPEFQRRYDSVELSLLTPKVALVPDRFFDPARCREALSDVVDLEDGDRVSHVALPEFSAVLVYSLDIGESLSAMLSRTVLLSDGSPSRVLPEMYWLLDSIKLCRDYNKILASYRDGWLHLVIAQGHNLLLANVFRAPDFTTAEYFIFLALKKLQMNPEVSTVCFRTPLEADEEMSLYRYFKSVEQI